MADHNDSVRHALNAALGEASAALPLLNGRFVVVRLNQRGAIRHARVNAHEGMTFIAETFYGVSMVTVRDYRFPTDDAPYSKLGLDAGEFEVVT